jgi:purine-binding chemotaxis protein CheW
LADEQWISFTMGSETYVHPIHQIKEIIPYRLSVPVPGSPRCIEGILNVRGNVITVLSGCLIFEPNEPKSPTNKRIIIIDLGADQIGVSVDSVGDIISFELDDAEWRSQKSQRQIIKGTLQLSGKLYILTDFLNYAQASDENK